MSSSPSPTATPNARVALNDFARQWADIREDVHAAVERVGASGWYILGDEVRAFERELAEHCGFAHAVGVASGIDAILIALRAHGCKPGDRVLTTPLSAFATTLAIVNLGAVPVFVDVDDRGQIDLAKCSKVIARRPEVRFFLPVHMYGDSPRATADWASARDVTTIDDCAQALGAPTLGRTGASSFYPTKNLAAMGDGGVVLTDDNAVAQAARELRDYGQSRKYEHSRLGYNSRLDELQAAILRSAMLPRLDRWNARRREIAERYLAEIGNPAVTVPGRSPSHLWHLFPVLVDPTRKAAFRAHLEAHGISTGEHYPTLIPDQTALTDVPFEVEGTLDTARRIARSEVSIPLHPYLAHDEVSRVTLAINTFEATSESAVCN